MLTALAETAANPNQIGTYVGMASAVISIAALTDAPITGALVSHYYGFTQAMIFSGVMVLSVSTMIYCGKIAADKNEKSVS
jgi:hypothetical protein